jgi:hypothetical protein
VLDLNTGVFTESGDMGQRLSGLGVGPGGVLYGSGYPYSSPNLYSINPTNGALTLVGTNFSPGFYDLGSTTTGLFAMGNNDGKLYSINPSTGAGSLIGPTLLGNFMSTGSSTDGKGVTVSGAMPQKKELVPETFDRKVAAPLLEFKV